MHRWRAKRDNDNDAKRDDDDARRDALGYPTSMLSQRSTISLGALLASAPLPLAACERMSDEVWRII